MVLPFTRIVELVVVVFRGVDHLWIKALVMRYDSPSVKSIQSVAGSIIVQQRMGLVGCLRHLDCPVRI